VTPTASRVERKSTTGTIGTVPTGPLPVLDGPGLDESPGLALESAPEDWSLDPFDAPAIPDDPGDPEGPGRPLDDAGEPSRIAIVARLARAIVTTAIQMNDGPPQPPRRRPPPTLRARDVARIGRA
jgi:hypothetical protein